MKKHSPILLALALACLYGCGSDDKAVEDAAKKSEQASGAIVLDKPASGPGKAMAAKPK